MQSQKTMCCNVTALIFNRTDFNSQSSIFPSQQKTSLMIQSKIIHFHINPQDLFLCVE